MEQHMWQRRHNSTASGRARIACGLVIVLAGALAACGATSTAHHARATATVEPTTTPLPKGWNQFASPGIGAEGKLTAVAAMSASDTWAVGQYEGLDSLQRTLTEHWNGTQWSYISSPSPGQNYNILLGLSADSASDAWAVGYISNSPTGQTTQPLIEHWNGRVWSAVSGPSIGRAGGTLAGVSARSAGDVWAVGYTETGGTSNQPLVRQPLIEHWNGSSWGIVASPTIPVASGSPAYNELNAVTALSANNVWAVGSDSSHYPTQALIEHWDGSHWTLVSGANPDGNDNTLSGIAAVSANDIWAVGHGPLNQPLGCGVPNGVLIEHWDGSHWSSVPFAKPPSNPYLYSFSSVTAVASNDVWAVGGVLAYSTGSSAAFTPLIEHWDGSSWSIVSGPANGTTQGLSGIAAAGGMVWAVGQSEAAGGPGATQVEQWNGAQWALVSSPSPGTLANALNGVTALAANDVWAVGGSAGGTLAEHWNGAGWSVTPSPNGGATDDVLNGVAAASSSDVWAVGSATNDTYTRSGLIEHWDGTHWSLSLTLPPSGQFGQELYGVAARSATDAWAVGNANGPLVKHWNGATWATVPFPPLSPSYLSDDVLFGVVALAATDVWVVGGFPPVGCGSDNPVLIAHWDGKQWSVVPNTPTGVLYGVAAAGPHDLWAVGTTFGGQLLMHWNGTSWSVASGPSTPKQSFPVMHGVAANSSMDVWTVGYGRNDQDGTIMFVEHWNGQAWSLASVTGPGLADNSLSGVAAVAAGDAWAVGAYDDCQRCGAQQALIERFVP
jgi:hypothetical protein